MLGLLFGKTFGGLNPLLEAPIHPLVASPYSALQVPDHARETLGSAAFP